MPRSSPDESQPTRQPPSQPLSNAEDEEELDNEEVQAQLAELRQQLAEAPASAVIANHCFGLFELAALHLSQKPPKLDDARLAIDALGCVVEGLAGRLGEQERSLKDGLSQLRLAYVQINAATGPSAQGGNGDEAATHTAE